MTEIRLQANLQPEPKKWEKREIVFLLKYYPLYKQGSSRYIAPWIRGHLQSRTMAAISKKYWTIVGSEHKDKIDINQYKFDFLQEKLE